MFKGRWAEKNDEELLRYVQRGEQRALTELYHRYSKKIVRYFHRMLWKDDEKAQDFLHDLFMKMIENVHVIDADKRLSTWIYAVAFNMCKNEYRKHDFRSAVSDKIKRMAIDEVHQPEVDDQNFSTELEKVLTGQDESVKNLFVLRYELDLSLVEIALILECPEGTVKSRLFSLRRKLAKHLHVYNPAIN